MESRSARPSLVFCCLGHAYMHLLVALYVTIVLALETAWNLPYDELISLWTVGALLVGAGAPIAGWLGDRWSAARMMILFFAGTGTATVLAGLARSPIELMVALSALGLFASIYHPVGMAWVVRNAVNRGKAMGVFGVFGSLGVAGAAITAGTLIDTIHWRAAFIVPGVVSLATGIALWICLRLGLVLDTKIDRKPEPAASRQDILRAFFVLSVTVFLGGLIYHSTQVAMPKFFAERVRDLVGDGVFGIGTLVTVVYLIGAATQMVGGHLADRYPLKPVYIGAYVVQVPLLFLAAGLAGLPLLPVALAMVIFNLVSLPAENCLIARYTPGRWRGTAFGAKFILSLGVAPIAVQLVALLYEWSGGFYWLFATLAAMAVGVILSALMLPGAPAIPARAPATRTASGPAE